MKRGEIWSTKTGEVLVIGADLLHRNKFPITYVMSLTANQPEGIDYPYTTQLRDNHSNIRWVNIFAIQPIAAEELTRKIGAANKKDVTEVNNALSKILSL